MRSAECGVRSAECGVRNGQMRSVIYMEWEKREVKKYGEWKKEQKRIGRISAVNSVDCIISIKKPLTRPFFISTLHTNKYV